MVLAGKKFDSEIGTSLVEVMVVIIIIGIVIAVALIRPGNSNNIFKRQNASQQLKAAFERARFDSVKRRADGTEPFANVEVRSDRFILTTYRRESNGTATPQQNTTMLPSGVVINHYSSGTLPMTITFNRRGETGGGTPQFRVCNINCSSPTSSTSDIVLVTATGTVNLLPGSSSIPTFSNPALAGNPAANASINNQVVVP